MIDPVLRQATPMVPVSDVAQALAFFQDVLGFDCPYQQPNYAYLTRDSAAIRLIAAAPDMDMTDPKRQLSCYIDVTGIDALYDALKPALDRLTPGRVRPPFNQPYGQREFHVTYEALLIFFGEQASTETGAT